MPKISQYVLLILLFSIFCLATALAEEITITTYYPSPQGSFNYLQADKLGVGDNNGDGTFNSADVPTTPGEVWINGNVGIGNGAVAPTQALDVNGIVKATAFQAGLTPGYNGIINVRKADDSGPCANTVINGIVTATTC